MKNYLLKLLVFTLVLAVAGALLFAYAVPQFYLPIFPWVLLFFASCSAVIHAYQMHLSKLDMGKFARGNMIVTFAKLLIYSAFAIIYLIIDKQNAKTFVAVFLILYFVFAVFELISLARIANQKKQN